METKYIELVLALVALVYLIVGYITMLKPATKINVLYGYRTKRSRKDQSSWDFAQKHSSRWMIISGLLLLVVVGISYAQSSTSQLHTIVLISSVLIIVFMPLYVTEIALSKRG